MPTRLMFAFLLIFNASFSQTNIHLLIGTYTTGKSEGIYVYNFNSANGDNSFASSVKTSNPSFLTVSPNQKMVYAVNENADSTKLGVGGAVTAFSFDTENGALTAVNQQFSGGKDPCYITTDKSGKWLFVANYSSGSAALFALKKDGSLDSLKKLIRDTGKGPNHDRQQAAHVHSTVLSPDDQFLFTPDLGIDKVMIYRFDKVHGKLTPAAKPFAALPAGSGPRHFDFHPNNRYAYLMTELTGDVVAYKYTEGKLTFLQRISALPAGFKGAIGSADIHVSADGHFLYCSNRGQANNISIFKVNGQTGKLTVVGHQSCMGKKPRNFNFDPSGNFLLVANEDSDNVVIFKVDKKTGLLTDTGKRINVPNPVCIKWIN